MIHFKYSPAAQSAEQYKQYKEHTYCTCIENQSMFYFMSVHSKVILDPPPPPKKKKKNKLTKLY